MASVSELLRPLAVVVASRLRHRFLENLLARLSEATFAARLSEEPAIRDQVLADLAELESAFLDGYDPTPIVTSLPALRTLREPSRKRLIREVQDAFARVFQPEERLNALRQRGRRFAIALEAWHDEVSRAGVGPSSASLWDALREQGTLLLEHLNDPELRTRWIP